MGQIAHMNISSCIISIPVLVLGNGFRIFRLNTIWECLYGNLKNWSIVACLNMFPNNSMLTFKPPFGPQYWHLRVIRSAKRSWGAEWTENRWLAKMQYWSTDHSFFKIQKPHYIYIPLLKILVFIMKWCLRRINIFKHFSYTSYTKYTQQNF